MGTKQTILVLGTAHLANPDNGDMFTAKTDDIFQENRQREIQSVVKSLAEFRPTKIALESPLDKNNKTNLDYQAFLTGDFSLTSNECHQIGFQLAKEVKHDKVYGVDWNGTINGIPDVEAWAKEHNSVPFDSAAKKGLEIAVNAEEYFKDHTVREFLLYMNQFENVRKNQEIYMTLALVGSKSEPVGAMWTAQYWYYRNMLIYKNLVELINSEEERIFVLYGSGHLHVLNQFLKDSGLFNIENVSDYL